MPTFLRRRAVDDKTPATPVREGRRFDDPVEAAQRVQHLPPPPPVPAEFATMPAPGDTPVPAAERSPADAAAAALRRKRAQLEAELAAERAARERAEAEATAAKAAREPQPEAEAPPAPAVPPPVWSAAGKLMLAVAGFITLIGTPLGVYLTARAAALEPKVDRTETKTNVTEQKTDTNAEVLGGAIKRISALEKCNQDRLNWYLELERQRANGGVQIRRPENLPAPSEVKVIAVPPAFRGRGPVMVVDTPPPC